MDIAELGQPTEVWRAVEGDRAELIALLRSSKTITRRTREALADWYEGKLKPVRLMRGRPEKHSQIVQTAIATTYKGHDPTTAIGLAGLRFERAREFIRKKRWHQKRAGKFYWSNDRLLTAIVKRERELARKFGQRTRLTIDSFAEYLKRSRRKPVPKSWFGVEYDERCRVRIALEIRRSKTRPQQHI